LRQDPNVVTQSLLAQISQQLSSANANVSIPTATPPTQTPFSPSASVVFVNSVWFLSLVLSLTCALMATLLQQWARRYLQIVQQNHPPHIRAHIREYFYQGARRFGLFGLVELLPFLLIVSVLLFFVGLVVFAFLANHTVAKFTLAIVGFCFLSYITFTLMPLVFHDCPYWTPLTTVLWLSSQKIGLALYWARDCGATYLCSHLGLLSEGRVELYHETHEKKAKLWSEDMVSQFEESAKRPSMEIYRKTLVWTIDQLDKDHEFEEFFAGIPDLYGSLFFLEHDVIGLPGTIRPVLAALPGPKSFDAPLSWSILWFALATICSDLPKQNQQKRLKTCFKALYFIPGAIRDLPAAYIADKRLLSLSLPLLDTSEWLEIIDELWDGFNDDVMLSVRCVAAVVAAFIITPPHRGLEGHIVARFFSFLGVDNTSKQFLAKRLRVGPIADGGVAPEIHPNSDSARLQNIVRFLADIKDAPQREKVRWKSCDNSDSIRRQRQELFDQRHTEEHPDNPFHISAPQGDRASPSFVPAVQQDLIILTLEILARGSVANAATSQREAFHDVFMELAQKLAIRAQSHSQLTTLVRAQSLAEAHVLPESRDLEGLELSALAQAQAQAPAFIDVIRRALEPVFQALQVPQNITPQDDHASSLQMPVPQNVMPYVDHASSHPMPVPQIATAPSTDSLAFPDPMTSPAGPSTPVGRLGDSHV
jgi:hypothetical protein